MLELCKKDTLFSVLGGEMKMNKNIEREFEKYLENIHDSAIMIDGDWGSGKTFFVKHSLKKKLRIMI